MDQAAILQIFTILLCTWREAECFFNTDTREPILRISPAVQNSSHSQTYGEDLFGFAIAFHQVQVTLPDDGPLTAANNTRIIVGAPKGTFPGGLNLPDPGQSALQNTGLVYTCSIAPGSDPPCGPILGDDADFDVNNDRLAGAGRLFDHRPNAAIGNIFVPSLQAEYKTGQLMGATVYSNNGTLVVCAPAWTVTGTYDPNIENPNPLNNYPILSNAFPQGRCYTTNRQLYDVRFFDPCNVRGEGDIQIDMGYCNAGTDVDMIEPGRIAIGSPGYHWGIGTVFYGRDHADMTQRDSSTRGRGNIRHPTANSGLQNIPDTTQAFQLTAAYITISRNDVDTSPNIIASAPRFDSTRLKGRVDVYDAREAGGDIQELLPITAEGQQMGEFFGYALAAMDLNGDRYDDVVVGAPMYSHIDPTNVNVENGRAYVFMNTGGNLSTDPIILEGTAYGGRFGMSLVNIGDIDRDGFEDVAIGAPYERDRESTGVVYIYYGSDNLNSFRTQAPAKICSQEIADNLVDVETFTTFGFSLAAFDVDNNEHNDLAIGAVDTGAVVLLRSRPVANVDVILTPSTKVVKRCETYCKLNGVGYPCFDVELKLCLSGYSIPDNIGVTVVVREMESHNEQRIFFGSDLSSNSIRRTVTLSSTTPTSFTDCVYVLNDNMDISSPIKIVAEVLQHEVTQFSAPTDGDPDIDDLTSDYIIRMPASDYKSLRYDCC